MITGDMLVGHTQVSSGPHMIDMAAETKQGKGAV